MVAACGGGGGTTGGATPDIVIVSQPTDLQVVDGAQATLSITVRGDAGLQWQRSQSGGWADINGATSAQLSLGVVHMADDGARFRVIVTNRQNPSDQLTSTTVTLKVTTADVAPAILLQPASASVFNGQQVLLTVTAIGTSPTYRWQRSSDGALWADIDNATDPTLALTATLQDDKALFRVVVSNRAGSVVSAPAQLAVADVVAPVFVLNPANVSILVGQGATFTAGAVGSPAPDIRWQVSTDNGNSWADVAGETRGSFTISVATAADDGKHVRAVAHNLSGDVFSASARLAVATPSAPTIQSQPQDLAVSPGMSATFSVAATGVPSVAYQWQVSTDGGTNFVNVNGATADSLLLSALTLSDDLKRFRVLVTNSAGSVTSRVARLRVMDLPTITMGPTSATWRPGQIDALFTVAAKGSELQYQWQLSSDRGATWADALGETGDSYLHAAGASVAVNAVRVVVSNARGAVSAWAELRALRWQTVEPRPTGADLLGVAWRDADTVVAAGSVGTIVRSTDGGVNWTVVSEGWAWGSSSPLRGIAFDANGVGITTTGEGSGNLPIKRSVDGGLHWVEVAMPVTFGLKAVAYNNAGAFCLAGNNGVILRSTDGGLHWVSAVSDAGTAALSAMAFNADGVGLIVGPEGTILRSINGGINWTRVASGGAELATVAFATKDVAFAGGADGTLLRSTDGGQTWQAVASGTTHWITSIHFSSATAGAMGVSQGGIRVTTDGGTTWAGAAPSPFFASLYAVRFGAGGKAIAVGEYGDLYRSSDAGLSWTRISRGAFGKSLMGVAFADASNGVAVGVGGALSRTTDGGAHWTAASSGTTSQLGAVGFFDSTTGVAVGSDGAIVRTVDGGASWAPVSSGTTEMFLAFAASSATGAVASTVNGLFRTTDAGASWTPVAGTNFMARGVAFGDPQTGVAVGDAGLIRRTTDGGAHWTTVNSGTTKSLFAVAFASPSVAIAVGEGGVVLRSDDGGATWQVGKYLGDYWLYGLAFVSPTKGVAAGTYGVVMVTEDGGLTWRTAYWQGYGGMSAVAVAGPHTAVAVGVGGVIIRNDEF